MVVMQNLSVVVVGGVELSPVLVTDFRGLVIVHKLNFRSHADN